VVIGAGIGAKTRALGCSAFGAVGSMLFGGDGTAALGAGKTRSRARGAELTARRSDFITTGLMGTPAVICGPDGPAKVVGGNPEPAVRVASATCG